MTPAERLAGYERDLANLKAQRARLQEELDRIDDDIYEKQIEIRECEDYMRVDEDEW